MQQIKELNAVLAQLRALVAGNNVEPGQKQEVEKAIETLRRFRRKPDSTRADMFRCVREVAENLLRAFLK